MENMKLNWPLLIGIGLAALALLIYLVRQNLKDKKVADREFKSFKEEAKPGYETNEEEL